MKVKMLKPTSSDAGVYGGMSNFQWDSIVEAQWIATHMASDQSNLKNGVLVNGVEFIRLGGATEAFKAECDYMWGTFEVIEK